MSIDKVDITVEGKHGNERWFGYRLMMGDGKLLESYGRLAEGDGDDLDQEITDRMWERRLRPIARKVNEVTQP